MSVNLHSVEINRKLIHLSSSYIPILYYFLDRDFMLQMLIFVGVASILFDFMIYTCHYKKNFLTHIISKTSEKFFRKHEISNPNIINSGSWFILGSMIVILLFEKDVAIFGIFVLIFCDTFASYFGQNFGKTKILDKSFEGFYGFLGSGLILILICKTFLEIDPIPASICIFVASVTELLSSKIKLNDNFTIPLSFCGSYYLIT